MMDAASILGELFQIRPDFRASWEGENYSRDDDGSFTVCGVFSQFTDFFRERYRDFTLSELTALAGVIRYCEEDEVLAEAAYTCFLENIAGDPPDAALASYLSPKAQEFMSHWRPTGKEPIKPLEATHVPAAEIRQVTPRSGAQRGAPQR